MNKERYIAIASFKVKGKYVGVRLFNRINEKTEDYLDRQVAGLIYNGYVIDNIKSDDGKLSWVQGCREVPNNMPG